MRKHLWHARSQRLPAALVFLCAGLMILAACSSGSTISGTISVSPALAPRQILTLPNVGVQDIDFLDPTQQPDPNDPSQGPDPNSALAIGMIYSGLVRTDKDLNVVPDQATWDISGDNETYTFHLKPNITFSDGTPVTAQTYVYTLTRALLPAVKSTMAPVFEKAIAGAADVVSGKKKALTGVRALNDQTLQITLAQPTPYFLTLLTNALYFPLNKQFIDAYGQTNWVNYVAGNGAGTGPFMVKEWDHNARMVLIPNPHYYGAKIRLKEVDMVFVNDPATAFKQYRAGQYDFVWNIQPGDLSSAKATPGFISSPQLQTDLLFFNNKMPPFDNAAVRQAFAYAIDKVMLAHGILKDAVTPAPTVIPPGMPGYQPDYQGIPYDKEKAKSLLQSVYPDLSQVPPVTFSYPIAQVSRAEASALQHMWQNTLNIPIKVLPIEPNAYNDEVANHQVQLGFAQWNADFPDPYDWLALNLLSTSPNNSAQWNNPTFDQLIAQAEQAAGHYRITIYNQAEQVLITDVGWLPLDHQLTAAIIPSWVHGITLNGQGLYFGDWSGVYLSPH